MQIERTAENEIRVTVDPADQKEYGVTYESMNFSDPRTRRFCEQIALLVCFREHLPERCDRLTVRAVRSEGGDLILYFTLPPEGSEVREVCGQTVEFFSGDALLDCRHFRQADPEVHFEVYRYEGRYFACLDGYLFPSYFDALLSDLTEYGRLSAVDRCFLREHGEALPSAAAYLLS